MKGNLSDMVLRKQAGGPLMPTTPGHCRPHQRKEHFKSNRISHFPTQWEGDFFVPATAQLMRECDSSANELPPLVELPVSSKVFLLRLALANSPFPL